MPRTKELQVSIAIKALDLFSAPMKAVATQLSAINDKVRQFQVEAFKNSSIQRFKESFRGLGNTVKDSLSLTGILGVGNAFKNVFTTIQNSFQSLTRILGRVSFFLAGLGFGAFQSIKNFIENTDGLARAARNLGLSAEALHRWRLSAELAGVSGESLQKVLRKIAIFEAHADAGNSVAKLALYQLGVRKFRDLQGNLLPTQQLLTQMAETLSKFKNPQQALARLSAIFGRNAYDAYALLGGGFSKDSEKRKLQQQRWRDDQQKIAQISFNPGEKDLDRGSNLRRSLMFAKMSMGAGLDRFMSALAPLLTQVLDRLISLWIKNKEAFGQWADEFTNTKLPQAVQMLSQVFEGVKLVLSPLLWTLRQLNAMFGVTGTTALVVGTIVGLPLVSAFVKLYAAIGSCALKLSSLLINFTPLGSLVGFALTALNGLITALVALDFWLTSTIPLVGRFIMPVAGVLAFAMVLYELIANLEGVRNTFTRMYNWLEAHSWVKLFFPLLYLPHLIVKHWDTLKPYFERVAAFFASIGEKIAQFANFLAGDQVFLGASGHPTSSGKEADKSFAPKGDSKISQSKFNKKSIYKKEDFDMSVFSTSYGKTDKEKKQSTSDEKEKQTPQHHQSVKQEIVGKVQIEFVNAPEGIKVRKAGGSSSFQGINLIDILGVTSAGAA